MFLTYRFILMWRLLIVALFFGVVGRIGFDMAIFLMQRSRHSLHAKDTRFLQIKMPRNDSDQDKNNDAIQSMKQNIEVMTQIYKSFYAISTDKILDRRF